MQDDAAANPDHGGCADDAENSQEHRHPANKGASERPAHTGKDRGAVVVGKRHTKIVGFHDQRYDAIHRDGDPESLAQSPSARLSFAVVPTWKPLQIITNVSASVGSVMQPAGFENAQNVLSAAYAKDGADPQWNDDPGMKKWLAFLDKYMPGADRTDGSIVYGYGVAQTMVKVLQMCGDDLTRANVMKQAASLKDFAPDTLLPGITINTSATDYAPIEQLQMMRFKGEKWDLFGDIISGELSN